MPINKINQLAHSREHSFIYSLFMFTSKNSYIPRCRINIECFFLYVFTFVYLLMGVRI